MEFRWGNCGPKKAVLTFELCLEKGWVSFLSGKFGFTSLALSQGDCPGPPHLEVGDQRRQCHKMCFLGDPPGKRKTFQGW